MVSQYPQPKSLSGECLDALLAHTTRETSWLTAARDLALRIRRSAAAGDLDALHTALQEQTALLAERDGLADSRAAAFGRAAAQLGIPGDGVTLGALVAQLSGRPRAALARARRELIASAGGLRLTAGGTLGLVAHKRQIIDGVLAALTGVSTCEARYTADGQRHDGAAQSLVECRT